MVDSAQVNGLPAFAKTVAHCSEGKGVIMCDEWLQTIPTISPPALEMLPGNKGALEKDEGPLGDVASVTPASLMSTNERCAG